MRDLRAIVRKEVAPLGLPRERELTVVEELALEIEEVHRSILEEGLSEDDAWAELFGRIPSWDQMRQEIRDAEPGMAAVSAMVSHLDRPGSPAGGDRRWDRWEDWAIATDLRQNFRRLWKAPVFTATTILTLAVCLAANVAILAIVNQVLLDPLPVPDPAAVMLVANQFPNTGVGGRGLTTAPENYYDRLAGVGSFSHQALFAPADRVLGIGDRNEQIHGLETTPSLFPLAGVDPILGRTFTEDEGELGGEDRIVLGYGLWQERFGRDPGVIGTTIRVTGRTYTVIGVMPEGFAFFDPAARYWIPLAFTPTMKNNSVANNWHHVGRLGPGATREGAQREVDAVNAALFERRPNLAPLLQQAGFHSTVEPLAEVLVEDIRAVLQLLSGAAAVVLLIGGLNIGNLTLAETHRRRRDLATRLALGAAGGRLAAGLLVESIALALVGGGLGLILASVALSTVGAIPLDRMPELGGVGIGGVEIGLAAGIAVLAGVAVGLAPMVHLRRIDLAGGLHENGRTETGGRRMAAIRKVLVTGQVAMAFVLLVGSVLLIATFRNLLEVDPGFTVENVVTAGVNVEGRRYANAADARAFLDRALEAVRSVPGVLSAGATTSIPLDEPMRGPSPIALSGGAGARVVVVEGATADTSLLAPTWVTITPGFFEAMGTARVRGRNFEDRDVQADLPVAIVDETMARAFWPAEDPIGKRLFIIGVRNIGVGPNTRWMTVVGVVPDLLLETLAGRVSSAGALYTTWAETNANDSPLTYGLVIRTASEPAALMRTVRDRLARLDPEMALFDVRTMAERRSLSVARERLAMSLGTTFGGIALFLSSLGVYGVLSYLVARRMREFGIRIALGSTTEGVFRLVLREGILLVGIGLAAGMGVAYGLRPALASQVYGIAPGDPVAIGAAAVVLVIVALAASLSPALRATRVDPLAVLSDQ